jgi:hypothetical protein
VDGARLVLDSAIQFRIQFLDGSAALVADIDRQPRAVTMRVLDLDRREVHSKG